MVPAASIFVWLGEFAGGYDNSDNWVADGGTDHPLPVTGDTMIFGVGGGSFDCVIPEAFSFAAVWIIADYGSTVTLQDNTVIGRLEMHSQDGSIAQLGSSATGYDLFITDWLNFTNGTLNSSSNTGIVHLDSLTFGLIGADNTIVTTGSTFSVENGTTLLYAKGTIAFANDATLSISANCLVDAAVHGSAQVGQGFVNVNQAVKPPLDLDKGTLNLEVDFTRGIVVSGTGILNINKSVSITGPTDINAPISGNLWMFGGAINVKNGVGITLTTGFGMSGGIFQTVDIADTTVAKTVYITGNMTVYGGTIRLGSVTNSTFGTLSATGNVFFLGGTFETKVNGTTGSFERDLWYSNSTFQYGCAAVISPTVLYSPPGGVVGRNWSVIESRLGLTGDAPYIDDGWDYLFDNPATKLSVHKLT